MTSDLLHALGPVSAGIGALAAAVLAVAAWGKFRAPEATFESLATFRVPQPARRRWVARALPVAEAILALALVAAPGWWHTTALGAAVAVFGAFWWLVAAAVARQEQASCNCFGKAAAPMTRHTVRRNQALTGGTALGLACSLPQPGGLVWQPGWPAALAVVLLGVLLWFGVRASAAETAAAAKDHAQLARTAGELGLRTPAGSLFPLARTARSSAVLLLFVQAAHSPSMHVMAAAQVWRDTDPQARTIKFVVNESELGRNIPPTLAEADVLLDSGRTTTRLAGIESYPAAILIGHDTRFAIDPVHGAKNIEVLLADLEQVWPRSTSS